MSIKINISKEELETETRKKISEAQKGKKHPMSEETKAKISKARWKYGSRIASALGYCKKKGLGFKPLNNPFLHSHMHHLQDGETVIFIPEELHTRIPHNPKTGENMNIIDKLALDYLELQMLGEVV